MIYQNHTLHMKGQNFGNFMSIKKVFEKDSNIMIINYEYSQFSKKRSTIILYSCMLSNIMQ